MNTTKIVHKQWKRTWWKCVPLFFGIWQIASVEEGCLITSLHYKHNIKIIIDIHRLPSMCLRSQAKPGRDQSGKMSQAPRIEPRRWRNIRSWKIDKTSYVTHASFLRLHSGVARPSYGLEAKGRQGMRGKAVRSKGNTVTWEYKSFINSSLVNAYSFAIE